MYKRTLKTFEEYNLDYELSKTIGTRKTGKNAVSKALKDKYKKMYLDYLLMMDVVNDNSNEGRSERTDVIVSLQRNDFDNDPEKFFESYTKSKRVYFLTPYKISDLINFKLFKVRGYNIGFAIKQNGDIVLVHNNESNIFGIGDLLIKKAIEHGGTHLDHFDGYLTGFYKRNGFKLNQNDQFEEEYRPKGWKYERVDIQNPEKSIYAGELKVSHDDFIEAKIRYENGKPDVVYRSI